VWNCAPGCLWPQLAAVTAQIARMTADAEALEGRAAEHEQMRARVHALGCDLSNKVIQVEELIRSLSVHQDKLEQAEARVAALREGLVTLRDAIDEQPLFPEASGDQGVGPVGDADALAAHKWGPLEIALMAADALLAPAAPDAGGGA
jgi:hypothetical protein